MLPVNSGGHSTSQNFILLNLRKYYPDSISRSTWDIIDRFWNLDLAFTDEFMRDKYSVYGPKPKTPSCMQRSYLLSIDFKVSSLTDWAAQLKINPLFATLSGFEFGDTPGVDTFYDFPGRVWDSDDNHLSPHVHPLKTKVKKPKTKGAKANPVEKKSKWSNCFPNWKTPFLISKTNLMTLFSRFTRRNSWTVLFPRGLSIQNHWL